MIAIVKSQLILTIIIIFIIFWLAEKICSKVKLIRCAVILYFVITPNKFSNSYGDKTVLSLSFSLSLCLSLSISLHNIEHSVKGQPYTDFDGLLRSNKRIDQWVAKSGMNWVFYLTCTNGKFALSSCIDLLKADSSIKSREFTYPDCKLDNMALSHIW